MKASSGPATAAIAAWYDAGALPDHWEDVREQIAAKGVLDPAVVYRVLDCAIFLDDTTALAHGLRALSEKSLPGRPVFQYVAKRPDIAHVRRVHGIYRAHFAGNLLVARYLVSLVAGCGLRRECCDLLLELHKALPLDAPIAKAAIKALHLAGRQLESVPVLEGLLQAGQLDKARCILLDRVLVEAGRYSDADALFEQGAAAFRGDLQLVADSIRRRDAACAVESADRIERSCLDPLPVTDEVTDFKIERRMRLQRYREALDIADGRPGAGTASADLRARRAMQRALCLSALDRNDEALVLLDELRGAGRLDRAGWTLLDRLLVQAGDRERAARAFEEGATVNDGNAAYIAGAIRSRDKALAIDEADRIEREYLDRLPLVTETAELKLRRAMRVHRLTDALAVVEECSRRGFASQAIAALGAQCYMELAMPARARQWLEEMESRGVSGRDGWAWIDYFTRTAQYARAREHIARLESTGKARLLPLQVVDRWKHEIAVFEDTASILARIPGATPPRGVVVFLTQGQALMHLWMGLTAAELKKAGYAVVFPYVYGRCDVGPTGDPDIDGLHGLLDFSMKRLTDEPEGIPARRFDWTIDPDRGIVSACGINFFEPICARIGTILRRYRFSFDHPTARATLETHVAMADAMLAICERIRRTLGARRIPVRFLSGMTQYVPAAVARRYCDLHGDRYDINYVAFAGAYEDYYNNLTNDRTSALSIRNLTRHKTITAPGRVLASEFEAWARRLDDDARREVRAQVRSIINFDRTRKVHSGEAELVLERIRKHRQAGGSVVCLFGKVLYDIWMDEPSGTVHQDIVDWLNHSIDAVEGSNTLLLVKPHPQEINPTLTAPSEFFVDLIKARINDNVVVCAHRWFNVADLLPYLNLGLLWSGTAGLELQASGIPVVMCGSWGLKDHPVPFVEARDRGHYASLLRDPAALRVTEDARERCVLLLKYYSTPEVMIPYRYGNMQYFRTIDIGPPRWHMDKVEQYLREGDPHVELMARYCL